MCIGASHQSTHELTLSRARAINETNAAGQVDNSNVLWPIGAMPLMCATRVLYSTAHVSLARVKACTI